VHGLLAVHKSGNKLQRMEEDDAEPDAMQKVQRGHEEG